MDVVERRLADFYGFVPLAEAKNHLVSRVELAKSLGSSVEALPEFQARGGVFLQESAATDDLFIGIHYDDAIGAKLEVHDPLARLDNDNLDEFCTLVEELSHFHLILNRQKQNRGVSKLELEWQGEVDKLLMSATLLEAQAGKFHLSPLARKLFDDAIIVSEDYELYWQATRHAARFWFAAASRNEGLSPRLREILRQSYQAPWTEKWAHRGRAA